MRQVLIVLALLAACTPEAREQMAEQARARKRETSQRMLEERAGDYWNALRWRNWGLAASFFEDEADQLAFLRQHAGEETASAMEDIEVRYAFVGGDDLEDGEIRVAWNSIGALGQGVQPHEARQRWYKRGFNWYLDPESELLEVRTLAPGPTAARPDESPLSP